MCLLMFLHRVSARAPLMLAANREEYFDRPFDGPRALPGPPRLLCGSDLRAGGTWLGVNEHGLVVAVTNRLKSCLPAQPRSRGALCIDLLRCGSATEAAQAALVELHGDRYAGANFACLDRAAAFVISSGDELIEHRLEPGVHLLTNGDLNDPHDMRQKYARTLLAPRFPGRPEDFVSAAQTILSTGLDADRQRTIVVRTPDRGTVCSTILTLAQPSEDSLYLYAPGSPDRTPFVDRSAALRELLNGRASGDSVP